MYRLMIVCASTIQRRRQRAHAHTQALRARLVRTVVAAAQQRFPATPAGRSCRSCRLPCALPCSRCRTARKLPLLQAACKLPRPFPLTHHASQQLCVSPSAHVTSTSAGRRLQQQAATRGCGSATTPHHIQWPALRHLPAARHGSTSHTLHSSSASSSASA